MLQSIILLPDHHIKCVHIDQFYQQNMPWYNLFHFTTFWHVSRYPRTGCTSYTNWRKCQMVGCLFTSPTKTLLVTTAEFNSYKIPYGYHYKLAQTTAIIHRNYFWYRIVPPKPIKSKTHAFIPAGNPLIGGWSFCVRSTSHDMSKLSIFCWLGFYLL